MIGKEPVAILSGEWWSRRIDEIREAEEEGWGHVAKVFEYWALRA